MLGGDSWMVRKKRGRIIRSQIKLLQLAHYTEPFPVGNKNWWNYAAPFFFLLVGKHLSLPLTKLIGWKWVVSQTGSVSPNLECTYNTMRWCGSHVFRLKKDMVIFKSEREKTAASMEFKELILMNSEVGLSPPTNSLTFGPSLIRIIWCPSRDVFFASSSLIWALITCTAKSYN